MNFVVTPIQKQELEQTMRDGGQAVRNDTVGALTSNLLLVIEVAQQAPPEMKAIFELDPERGFATTFTFGLHTGMELQRRITKSEPERLLAGDMPGAIARLVEKNDGQQNVHLADFGYVSLDVAVAAIAAVGAK